MEWWYISSPCYLVVPGASLVPRSPPTIEELLWTIRDAWPPPRSLSLDSEKRNKPKEVMGTGSKKDQPAPRMGLPYRRYSVPETVMRKYSLSRAQTSASDVVTAPTPSVPSIGTSSGATRRMCHKACQTSPPGSASQATIPTVSVTAPTTLGAKEELSKHSSNSNEFSPSEEVSDYGACVSQVYKSELSLPGAVVESARFLKVPELILDPHDSPQVVYSENDGLDAVIINSEHINTPVVRLERDECNESGNTDDNRNISNLLEQSDTHHSEQYLGSQSNSLPEYSEPTTRTNQTISSAEEHQHDPIPIHSEELTMEQQLHFDQSLSPEGTPTPALTCHTYDSQGNMLSECYITDCEVCNAEGRKCCSLDDSGSQTCSFTSPDMISSNDLKSSTDFTTSSMTLDQTVSDRTTSTQDSTISLTSITPESAESKEKSSNLNISPILVIDSETTLLGVSSTSKSKNGKKLAQSPVLNESELSNSKLLFNSIPPVISCESGIVPEVNHSIQQNNDNTKFETKEDINIPSNKNSVNKAIFPELNNNKITISKGTCTSEPLSTIQENDIAKTSLECAKNQADHYLYLTESESGETQDSTDAAGMDMRETRKLTGNYTTSHLYLTETESSPTDDAKEGSKHKTGAYATDYLYMTESESSTDLKTLSSEDKRDANGSVNKVGDYATNYMYMTDSESSGLTKVSDMHYDKTNTENRREVRGNYAKNYLYITESESPDTNQSLESSRTSDLDKNKVEKQISAENYTAGAYATDYLYMTESESSGATKTLNLTDKKEIETVRKNVGSYAKNYLYITESESPETNKTPNSTDDNIDLKDSKGDHVTNYFIDSDKSPSEACKTPSASAEDFHCETNSAGKFATDYLYMTESETSDTAKKTQSKMNELEIKSKNVGNYSSNYMYMTDTESPKSNQTTSSQENKTIEIRKTNAGNYTKDYLYMTESETSSETKTSTAEIMEGKKCIHKSVGNAATDYLYLTESESSGDRVLNMDTKGDYDVRRKTCGESATNYLYLTESESSNTTKPMVVEDKNVRYKTGGQYATSHLYITESESTLTVLTNSLSPEVKEETASVPKHCGNSATNYMYITESDSSGITKVSTLKSSCDIEKKKTSGNYTKGFLYMTESESPKTETPTEKENENEEDKINRKHGKTYTTNYMYMTEDESGFNPDSLEIDRRSSREEYEMDSLAINESTDESNLLENLGFCDDISTVKCQSNATNTDPMKSEYDGPTLHEQQFCGNSKFEILLKDTDVTKINFKGNVMPALGINIAQQERKESALSIDKMISKSEMKTNKGIDLENETEVFINSELGCNMVDRETTMGSVAGGTYWEIPGKELVIPRFSALPRTLSMIVNTSSMDCSSDSDLSLADSLEDNKSDDKNKGLKLYNKYDNRLVRGDIIALLPEESEAPKKPSKESQAYFLSITGEEGDIKVEQIPEDLKKKLLKRDMEVRKHSDHLSGHGSKCKGKNCTKKSKKSHHNHSCQSTADHSSKSSSKTRSLDEFSSKISKFTQWEDLDSSKDSSDTLVPSDFSEKDKDAIFQGDYKLKDVSTSPHKGEFMDNNQQNDLNCWLETVNKNCTVNDEETIAENVNTLPKCENEKSSQQATKEMVLQNKWVQCENMPHVDSNSDEEIAHLLIENSKDSNETDESLENKSFKCAEHKVPWSKDMFVQVSQEELVQDIVDVDVQTSTFTESKLVQTADILCIDKKINERKPLVEETNKIELNLTGSPRIQNRKQENQIKCLNVPNDDERCKTPEPGEGPDSKNENILKQDKLAYSKPSPKFNVKSTPPRRTGNLGTRFKQKFEVIPEEKSGSLESSNDEKKSPKPVRGRRASMPSDMILKDIAKSQNKSSDSSSSSNDKKDTEDCDHVRNIQTSLEGGDYHRRHTIHGNLTSRNTKTEASNPEKNEHSRRHTIHGSLSLSKNDAMLKQLNMLGGTLLKGRVFGKQSGVMFGRFRPINEETQVQKDERSLVEEQLERLRRDPSKGREALAVARTEGEQDELLTLSKGWINFYLLRDSQDLGSDGSNGEEGLKESRTEDRSKRSTPLMKTVTVVGKSEEDLRHQFTVQINASPETCQESGKLPDIGDQNLKSFKTPSLSPDLTLPDITPTSSPVTTPPLTDTPLTLKPELPQIHPKGVSRNKRSVNEKYKSNGRKPPEKTEKRDKVHIENDQNLRYMKLSSMKQELQTEKTYFARSGEVACSELSQSSSTSVTADSPTLPSIKWPSRQLQRRSHSRHLHTRAPPANPHPNPQACWTVTLAGSSGNPTQPPPDVEMRLSFSNQLRGAPTSQSDSGLGEDGPPERGHRGSHPHHALPPASKHPPHDASQWKVLLKTHQETERSSDQVKADKRASLPDFNFLPGTARQKKNSKRGGRGQEDPSRPSSVQVQEILEHNISLHKSSLTEEEWVEGLSITGQAITPERKPRVPTMSERDLTRQWYHRSRLFH